jgi:hypothetical protein
MAATATELFGDLSGPAAPLVGLSVPLRRLTGRLEFRPEAADFTALTGAGFDILPPLLAA